LLLSHLGVNKGLIIVVLVEKRKKVKSFTVPP